MLPQNDFLLQHEFLDHRRAEIQAEVKKRSLLRQAGIIARPWLTCQICHTLWHLGRALIQAGQRLERRYAAAALMHA